MGLSERNKQYWDNLQEDLIDAKETETEIDPGTLSSVNKIIDISENIGKQCDRPFVDLSLDLPDNTPIRRYVNLGNLSQY